MPTADERLKHVTLKMRRAKEHVTTLERELHAFIESDPYKVGAKHDPKTHKLVYYVTAVESVPDSLPLIAGDAIQNLMSTLDHLAYQVVCNDTGDAPPNPNWIYFPIADDAEKYEAKKRGKMEGASQKTFDIIDKLKPYKGGNDLLWALYRLNNIEKHRLLLTVGSQAAGINMSQLIMPKLASLFKDDLPAEMFTMLESRNIFMMPADKGFPLKPGFELLLGGVDEKVNPKQEFKFSVALNEPGVIDGKPLHETVNQLSALVDGIVSKLTSRLQ